MGKDVPVGEWMTPKSGDGFHTKIGKGAPVVSFYAY